MKFVPFGDSHCVFWGNQQGFDAPTSQVADTPDLFWLGPAKIFGLDNPTSNQTQEKFLGFKHRMEEQSQSVPIACFGEIDIRVNIAKLVLEDLRLDCIDKLADIYLRKLNELPNERIVIWGPPPASMDPEQTFQQDYPVFGSAVTRNSIVHLFNTALLRRINEYPRIRFITLFYDLTDERLNTIPGALHDFNHLSIAHFQEARNLLVSVLSDTNKAAFNLLRMQSIAEISLCALPPEHDALGYTTNMQFLGPLRFQYFTSLRFTQDAYVQTELVLRPGPAQGQVLAAAQLGDIAFLEMFFQGKSDWEFSQFARFCSTFNGTAADIFDAKDSYPFDITACLRKHEKTMRRKYALLYGIEALSMIEHVEFAN
jgi:hypothetical protein